jgi:hypothetical protein
MKRVPFLKHLCIIFVMIIAAAMVQAQTCSLTMSVVTTDSRCKATGTIAVSVTGGSGNYNYTVTGPSFTTNTSSSNIGGLSAGVYKLNVKDISSNCTVSQTGIVVAGNYKDPRFTLNAVDETCQDAGNGSISVSNIQYGRAPFLFRIVAPSASNVGLSNGTGVFNNLAAGHYTIQLSDSCGGIQTRVATIAHYSWTATLAAFSKPTCDSFQISVTAADGKGNTNISNPALFTGFVYGATVTPGDTVWSGNRTFRILKGNKRNGMVVVKDGCGNYRYIAIADNTKPNANASVNISNQACSDYTASITGQQNLTSPQYCLYDNTNTQVSCNTTGVFNNIPYGLNYYITIKDICYDTSFTRPFIAYQALPYADNAVAITNRTCSGFTATTPSWSNMTNPQFCIKDSDNIVVSCNTTGVFTNLPYGPYCLVITDPCTGGVITRCFTERIPKPAVSSVIASNKSCATFTATVVGQANTTNPQYCLYDANNALVGCNTTGIFNNLAYGSYCMHMQNDAACYDTTIISCFSVGAPAPSAATTVAISNKACTTFSASITGQQNFNNPQYCLFDAANTQVACNSTGVFNGIDYGSYCIKIKNDPACFDTTITRCFTISVPQPAVAATVTISNKACTTFSATVGGLSNITNPQFSLFDITNTLVGTNTTGVFNNLPFGDYCVHIKNDASCFDTTIIRCFQQYGASLGVSASSTASCTLGNSNLRIVVSNGVGPFTATVYNPGGAIEAVYTGGSTTININDIAGLPAGVQYKVVIESACEKDSVNITPVKNTLNRNIDANAKCPGGRWLNGSGDLLVTAQFSAGTVTPSISAKNGVPVTINYSSVSGDNYTFNDMEPATYVVKYWLNVCGGTAVYDTFALDPYDYPNLDKSAVYQCNNNNFSVSAAVTGGVAPYTYEVIGSMPSAPSIIAGPQAAATFSIGNGVNYSLVRLRAIDACGNATINDASILPLANTIVTASSNCYYTDINLSVDTVANATYTWYKKTSYKDSVLVSNNQTHTIPYLLPSDTGTYVSVMSVNNGCLTKVSSFHISGMCGGLLAVNGLTFNAAMEKDNVQVKWTTLKAFNASKFFIEKSTDGQSFTAIGSAAVAFNNSTSASQYFFADLHPVTGKNFYRLRIISTNGKVSYSDIATVYKKGTVSVSVMPNPVAESFTIKFQPAGNSNYAVQLMSADGKTVMNYSYAVRLGDAKTIQRPAAVTTGVYYLVVVNQANNDKEVIKLFFK